MQPDNDHVCEPDRQPKGLSVVLVTAPDQQTAQRLARGLVTNKLAACVNLVPTITSIYEWKGTLSEDSECLCIIKTSPDVFEKLSQWVSENHPYEVPEIVAIETSHVNSPYLNWVQETMEKTAG